jgi:alkylmercury lyase
MAGFLDDLSARARAYTPEETTVARACFNALLTGSPVGIPDLLSRLAAPAEAVTAILAALQQKGVLAIDADGVTVARGLSRLPTAHRLSMNAGPVIFACCAVDAIGIPAALGGNARVTSRCHACMAPIAIAITGGRLVNPSPAVIIWAADTDHSRSLREYT